MITQLELTNFSAFDHLTIDFSSNINVIIGDNGTGKTHLLKIGHALASGGHLFKSRPDTDTTELKAFLTDKFLKLFMPLDDKLGKLVHLGQGQKTAEVRALFREAREIEISLSTNSQSVSIQKDTDYKKYKSSPVFIPTKEVLSFMKGFNSLYKRYELSFDQSYQEICVLLDLPVLRSDKMHPKVKDAMDEIEKVCKGRFVFYGGGRVTFKSDNNSEYSANVMAEGFRKMGMLSRLLETGSIEPGISGPLFWDEPESNINPKLIRLLVKILFDLSQNGQQIILATHDYVLLKWLHLTSKELGEQVTFHALYRDAIVPDIIRVESCNDYHQINKNSISDSFAELYDEDIRQALN
ncbi:MAG: Brex system ATPase [Phormidesmis priestleyi Ana]|uniref:Brex system ATPase n=1 Tax=Phormidesmis priestleyi Ana TaxID=1666911 RepID=A0A0P7ZRA5_9CYAN|nr:MAG: Brex system ATPase [Phormidesmis priestleyi Ana]